MKNNFLKIFSKVLFLASTLMISCNTNDDRGIEDDKTEDSLLHQKWALFSINDGITSEEKETAELALLSSKKFIFYTSRDTLYGDFQSEPSDLNPDTYKKITFTNIHTKDNTPPQNQRDILFINKLENVTRYKLWFSQDDNTHILEVYPKEGTIYIGGPQPYFAFGIKRLGWH